MKKRRHKRNVKIVFPSTITSFAMIFGFIAILLASTGHITKACYMVLISQLMDGLDGKVARFTNTASEFGIQYDSLADLVAFGVAPCVIYSHFYLHQQVTDSLFYLLPIMFLTCGAIRLARFNVTASIYGKTHFTGLPIPAAAFALVMGPLFYEWSNNPESLIYQIGLATHFTQEKFFQASIITIILLSLSMISTIKFDTPGTFWIRKFPIKWVNFAVLLGFFSIWIFESFPMFGVSIALYYLISMYARAIYYRLRRIDPANGQPLDESVDYHNDSASDPIT